MNLNNWEYFIVLIISFGIPAILTFHPGSSIKRKLYYSIPSIILIAIPWIIWDIIATNRGHWAFNSRFNLGIYLGPLPFEEVLFFILIPYSMLFIWNEMRDYKDWKEFVERLSMKKKSQD